MKFILPPRLKKGDKVAIVSPSAGLPFLFPGVYQLGLKRLREVFHLEPVEFPTALKSPEYLQKNPRARADDLNAAFADSSIKGIIATIGGNDQIRILPFLDGKCIAANPKIFLGYSDNTNFHLFLWNLGIISYYGGNLMNQFGMQGRMHDFTVDSLKKALFEKSIGEIHSSPEWTDVDLNWEDPQNLLKTRPMFKSEGWIWHNEKNPPVQGKLWGGCLEVIDFHLSVKRFIPQLDRLSGSILYLETSEEMPTEGFVYRFIASLGELGILKKFKAILCGRPKTQFCGKVPPDGSERYAIHQREAVKKALSDYECDFPVIFNLNFGHADPQTIIPNGGEVLIDCARKTISFC